MVQRVKFMSNDNNLSLYERMMRAQVKAQLSVYNEGKAGRWPMPIFPDSPIIGIYSSPFIAELMWQVFQKLENDEQRIEKMRKAYLHPSRLARTIHLYPQRALWPLTTDERAKFGDIVAEILLGMYKRGMFCEDGSNIIYTDQEITNLFNKNEPYFIEDESWLLKKLSGTLWMLAESFFPRWHNTFHEYSGPYKINDNKILLKEFHDLKPDYLPKENLSYQFKNITIIEEYKPKAEFTFDIQNRVSGGKANESLLTRYSVMVDGQPQKIDDLPELIQALQNSLQMSVKYLQAMDKEQIIIFNGRGEYYALVYPLTSVADLPKDLPADFYERAKNPEITLKEQEVWDWIKQLPKDKEGFRYLFDVKLDMIKV